MRIRFLLLPALLCLPLAGQSKGRTAPKTASKKPPASPILWSGVMLESAGFEGELKSDLETLIQDDVIVDEEMRVDPRPTRVAWRLKAESEREAKTMFLLLSADAVMSKQGLVRVTTADYKEYQKRYRNFPDLPFLSQRALIYRPKDAETFKQALEKVKLIGSRERGRMVAMISQLFVVVEPRDFVFGQGQASFSVRLSTLLYGAFSYQGERAEAGPVEESSQVTALLIGEMKAKLQEESRLMSAKPPTASASR